MHPFSQKGGRFEDEPCKPLETAYVRSSHGEIVWENAGKTDSGDHQLAYLCTYINRRLLFRSEISSNRLPCR